MGSVGLGPETSSQPPRKKQHHVPLDVSLRGIRLTDVDYREDSAVDMGEESLLLLAQRHGNTAANGGLHSESPHLRVLPRATRLASTFTLLSESDEGTLPACLHEAKRLVALGAPLAGSHFANFALSLISVAFIGRLGEFELSVAILATSFYNVTGLSILIGFVGAQETLCGQAFGARSYRAVGVVLQRAVLLNLIVFALLAVLWTQLDRFMLAIKQDPAITAGAHRFLLLSIPALLAAGLFEVLKRYLMAQNVVRPSIVASCAATALSPLYNWLAIFRLGWGLDGAVLAMTAAEFTQLGVIVTATVRRDRALVGTPQQTWHGWSFEALQEWPHYLRLALPSTAMCCMEWWTYELCVLMSGWLPNPKLHVAVMGLCMHTAAALYMFPFGLSSAVSVRVSNALGAGLPQGAKRSARTAWCMALGMQLVFTNLVLISRNWLAYLFTNVREVVHTAAQVFPLLALTFPGDGISCVLSGVLRGAGRQGVGAALNLVTYWCLGLPIAALLAFKAGWGITGLWSGLVVVTLVQAVAISTVVLRFNWEREAQRAADNIRHTVQAAQEWDLDPGAQAGPGLDEPGLGLHDSVKSAARLGRVPKDDSAQVDYWPPAQGLPGAGAASPAGKRMQLAELIPLKAEGTLELEEGGPSIIGAR